MEQRKDEDEVIASPSADAHRLRNGLIWTAGLLLVLLGIGLAVPDLRNVLDRVAEASLGWIAVAIGLEIASCLGYVATVRMVLSRGPARELRWLAWAEMAFGAVVPVGGAGGLAVGAWAMRAWGIAWSRIVNRSAVIFLLTTAVNTVVLIVASFGISLGLGGHARNLVYSLVPGLVAAFGLILFMALPRVRPRESRHGMVAGVLRRTADWVSDTEALAFRPDWRLLGTAGYLLFDIAMLWVCMRAVGLNPPVLALVMGYQIGYLANLIPVPGGVGVLEGGLLGALLLYGFPVEPTAAAVVIYHAIALWVPALGGTFGFARLRRAVASGIPARPTAPDRKADHLATPPAVPAVSNGRGPDRGRDAKPAHPAPPTSVRDRAA